MEIKNVEQSFVQNVLKNVYSFIKQTVDCRRQTQVNSILYIILPSVGLYALTLYPATADCPASTDISGVTGCWQLSR